jgi:hypothetical protein
VTARHEHAGVGRIGLGQIERGRDVVPRTALEDDPLDGITVAPVAAGDAGV